MIIKSAILQDEFIPEFNENKKLPLAEQIVVEIKAHISNLQLSKYKSFIFVDGATKVEYDDTSIMINHVGNLRNFEDGNGKIKNGIELADSTNKLLYPLMIEIRNHLINESELLPEGESKASE